MGVDRGNFFENQREIELRLLSSTRTENTYSVEEPDGGKSRTFDPNNYNMQNIADFLATLAADIMG